MRTHTGTAVVAARAMALALGAALLTAGGCWTPGGWNSDDSRVFQSAEYLPQTVSLVDTRTQQVVWTYDVPVGRQLVTRFVSPSSSQRVEDPAFPDTLMWDDWESGQMFGNPNRQQKVPPRTARRWEVSLRPGPEAAKTGSTIAPEVPRLGEQGR